MVWEGGIIADASVNIAWEAANALTSGGKKISPRTLKAMQDGEFNNLFDLILKAGEQNPD